LSRRHHAGKDAPRAGFNISEGTFGGHLIEFCDVFDTVRETGDHGSLNQWGREVDRNLFTTSDADRTEFAGKGCDAHSLVGDPLLVDAARGDFRVRDGSPALTLGFQNFPMDHFGVQKRALKALAQTPDIPPLISKAGSADGAPLLALRTQTAIFAIDVTGSLCAISRNDDARNTIPKGGK